MITNCQTNETNSKYFIDIVRIYIIVIFINRIYLERKEKKKKKLDTQDK